MMQRPGVPAGSFRFGLQDSRFNCKRKYIQINLDENIQENTGRGSSAVGNNILQRFQPGHPNLDRD
jgi:hypothetical protein